MFRVLLSAALVAALVSPSRAADPIVPFNGKDLTGWKLKDEKKSQWKVMRVTVNDVSEPPAAASSVTTRRRPTTFDIYPDGRS